MRPISLSGEGYASVCLPPNLQGESSVETPSPCREHALPSAWSRRAERRTCESWLDTEQALILGVKVAMSYLVNSMAVRLVQAIYMEGPVAVFTSLAMSMRQSSRTISCSAHLLIWRRVERKADSGCIYWVCRPRFFASPVCGKRHVDRYAVFHRDAPCVQNHREHWLSKFGGRERYAQIEPDRQAGATVQEASVPTKRH